MKPASRPRIISTKPTIQLSSRGLRKAPVKNTRIMCVTIDAMKSSAAQWWIWRISRPPRTSKDSLSVEAKASDISWPLIEDNGPWYSTRPIEGTKNIVRKTPEMSSTTKE